MKSWPIAQPLHESAEGLGSGAPDAVLDTPLADEGGSLSDHEASFSPEAQAAEPATDEKPTERDDTGRFKPRHRAKSQRASAEDVPRIAELTKNWRTAESERDALKAEREALARERDELKAKWERERPAAEPAKPAKEPAKPVTDASDPEPREEDFDNYGLFTRAAAKWEIRQARREEDAAAAAKADADRQVAMQAEFDTKFNAWVERRTAFLANKPERAPAVNAYLATVNAGTPIGDTILDSDVGAELADYLAANPDEDKRIKALSPVSAIRALGRIESTLVASEQRSPSSRSAAAPTGSAPVLVRPPAPRPPNPVRTGSIAEPDTPPDADDQSLSAHEKHYGRKYR